jgi:hypothetical protein
MSLSVKAPVWIDKTSIQSFIKRQAGKAVRRISVFEDIPSGGHYRKHYAVLGDRKYNPDDIINHNHTMYGFTDRKGISHRFIIK